MAIRQLAIRTDNKSSMDLHLGTPPEGLQILLGQGRRYLPRGTPVAEFASQDVRHSYANLSAATEKQYEIMLRDFL